MTKIYTTLILVTILLSSIFSAVPFEKFYVDRSNIPEDFLKLTTGVITLSSGVNKESPLIDIYADDFIEYEGVDLQVNSQPISNYGYHPPIHPGISGYRYLIIAENEKYLKIVYDFVSSKSGWVPKDQIEERFYSSIKNFKDLETNYSEFLSLFDLQIANTRKVYTHPTNDSNFSIISKLEVGKKEIKILDQSGDFIKIAVVEGICGNKFKIVKELGWTKMKDDQGAINIWVIRKDLC